MGDIVSIADRLDTAEEDGNLRFLADEGLELLASYRLIKDPDVRRAVLTMVKSLAKAGAEAKP